MFKCLICQTPYEPFISFGPMPLANGFCRADEFANEYSFELKVGLCANCGMVQLAEQPDRSQMFNEHYAFFSSTSTRMALHFKELAHAVMAHRLNLPNPFVVELGSNDGIMLQHFAQAGIRHLGVEPSANVAQKAIERGVNTISQFFDEALARQIVAEYGQADVVLGANVMCHIPYLHSVAEGIRILLKPTGVLIFEDPYLGDIVEKTSYDQIYDEHVFYFSAASISYLFRQHGLELVDVAPQNVHGGSMRYVIAPQGAQPVAAAATAQRAWEEQIGLHQPATFNRLRANIEQSRAQLLEILHSLKRQGKRVVGYGATSKSTTVINYCGITPDLVEFISDTTPIKQGKFSPGAHIPVKSYQEFTANYPDYALLFAWNHAGEIMEKEQKFKAAGGKWLVYVPKVQVLA